MKSQVLRLAAVAVLVLLLGGVGACSKGSEESTVKTNNPSQEVIADYYKSINDKDFEKAYSDLSEEMKNNLTLQDFKESCRLIKKIEVVSFDDKRSTYDSEKANVLVKYKADFDKLAAGNSENTAHISKQSGKTQSRLVETVKDDSGSWKINKIQTTQ